MASHRNGDVAARVAVRFEEVFESLRLIARHPRAPAARAHCTRRSAPRRTARCGVGWVEGWRGEVLVALEPARTAACAAASARSVVAELAGAGARGDRQHRSRLPADQQIVQPVLRGRGPLSHVHRSCSTDRARPASSPSAPPQRRRGAARRSRSGCTTRSCSLLGRALADPPRRCRLLQRLRAGDPRAQQPLLQPRGAGHQVRRQPAPRRHAAGHRPGVAQHGSRAASAPTTPRPSPSWWSRSATAAAPAGSSARATPAAAGSPT